jgi:hypothetical protein
MKNIFIIVFICVSCAGVASKNNGNNSGSHICYIDKEKNIWICNTDGSGKVKLEGKSRAYGGQLYKGDTSPKISDNDEFLAYMSIDHKIMVYSLDKGIYKTLDFDSIYNFGNGGKYLYINRWYSSKLLFCIEKPFDDMDESSNAIPGKVYGFYTYDVINGKYEKIKAIDYYIASSRDGKYIIHTSRNNLKELRIYNMSTGSDAIYDTLDTSDYGQIDILNEYIYAYTVHRKNVSHVIYRNIMTKNTRVLVSGRFAEYQYPLFIDENTVTYNKKDFNDINSGSNPVIHDLKSGQSYDVDVRAMHCFIKNQYIIMEYLPKLFTYNTDSKKICDISNDALDVSR